MTGVVAFQIVDASSLWRRVPRGIYCNLRAGYGTPRGVKGATAHLRASLLRGYPCSACASDSETQTSHTTNDTWRAVTEWGVASFTSPKTILRLCCDHSPILHGLLITLATQGVPQLGATLQASPGRKSLGSRTERHGHWEQRGGGRPVPESEAGRAYEVRPGCAAHEHWETTVRWGHINSKDRPGPSVRSVQGL